MNLNRLKEQLSVHEGVRYQPYKDTEGYLTIGVGHNLDAKPLSHRAVMVILEDDIADVVEDLHRALPWWAALSEARQLVLADMCFNLGIGRLQGFKNALAAMQNRDWDTAADEMLDSKWARQVGRRAETLANMMRVG